ncbi:MAG: DUF2242 domain-containing protein, partial [Halieaceae bacterium]|nr:DUF2242 domain-containing protein [Halieaceae bacterium]
MKHSWKILFFCLCLVFQTGCSNQAVYTSESFAIDSPFKVKFDAEVAMACEGARRSLLGQGYLIESSNSDGVKARKAYKNRDDENTFIEMTIVCLPETSGSTLFATGVLSAYALKKSTSSASVGLSALGSISLPIGQSADSLVKVSEETISDRDFYGRFFAAVDNALGEMRAGQAVPERVKSAEATEPAPVEAPSTMVPETLPERVAPISAVSKLASPESSSEPLPDQMQDARPVMPEQLPAAAPTAAPAMESAPVQTIHANVAQP